MALMSVVCIAAIGTAEERGSRSGWIVPPPDCHNVNKFMSILFLDKQLTGLVPLPLQWSLQSVLASYLISKILKKW